MGVRVTETAVPVEGFKVMPVIPTLADTRLTFARFSEGEDVRVRTRVAF